MVSICDLTVQLPCEFTFARITASKDHIALYWSQRFDDFDLVPCGGFIAQIGVETLW